MTIFISAEQLQSKIVFGEVVAQLYIYNGRGGNRTYRVYLSSGANVDMVPIDISGKVIDFATVDALIVWLAGNCDATINLSASVVELFAIKRPSVPQTIAQQQTAKRKKLAHRRILIVEARERLVVRQNKLIALGYHTSTVPAQKQRYDDLMLQIARVDDNLQYINFQLM